MVNNSTNINQNHLSLQLIEWWSTIQPISTKMVNNSTNINKNHLSPITHWVMVNNSTNINKITSHFNSLKWWSTIPPISTKITSHLNSLSDGQQFHQYQQKSPLTITHWVMVNNSTNINNNHFSPQQQWPLTSTHWVMVNNSTITKITSHFNLLKSTQL